jgi:hypothetical protein
MVDVNEVRRIADIAAAFPDDWKVSILARFARAVLDPPAEVAEAVERLAVGNYHLSGPHYRKADSYLITDYFLTLTAAPEKSAGEKGAGG